MIFNFIVLFQLCHDHTPAAIQIVNDKIYFNLGCCYFIIIDIIVGKKLHIEMIDQISIIKMLSSELGVGRFGKC